MFFSFFGGREVKNEKGKGKAVGVGGRLVIVKRRKRKGKLVDNEETTSRQSTTQGPSLRAT